MGLKVGCANMATRGASCVHVSCTGRLAAVYPSLPRATPTLMASSPVTAAEPGSYAILDMGNGLRQFVEEGRWFACRKPPQARDVAPGNTVTFEKVVAVKQDGAYRTGRPYLQDVVVETIFEEEFDLGCSGVDGGISSGSAPRTAKYLVTKIAHTHATAQALQHALNN